MRPPQFRRRVGSRGFLSAGTAVVLLVSSMAMVVGSGFSFGETKLKDGVTWIFNRKDGEVARVNGSSGKVDLKIALPGSTGKDLELVQRDDHVLVVDPATGQVASLDVNGLEVAARTDFGSAEDLDVVLGDDAAYVVDRVAGTVQRIDPVSLERLGEPVRVGEDLSEGVADDAGRLWVARGATGEIVRIDPDGEAGLREAVRRGLADPGATLEITTTEGGIVVTDTTSGRQWRLDADGNEIGSIEVAVPEQVVEERYTPPASEGPYVPITTDYDDGPGVVVPPAAPGGGGPVQEPIPVDDLPVDGLRDADLGAAVALGDRVYLPIPGEGVLVVLDRDGVYLETISVPGEGDFLLILDDGRLWVNDPDDPSALRIDGDGTVTEVEKAADAVPTTPPTTPEAPDPDPDDPDAPTPPDPDGGDPSPTTTTPAPPTTTTPSPTTTAVPITVPPTTTTTRPGPTTTTEPVPDPKRPQAPVGLVATPGDASVALRWGAAPDGGARLQRQDLSWTPEAGCGRAGSARLAGDAVSHDLAAPAVENGCTYSFSLTATNRVGTGPAATASARPSSDQPATPAAPVARLEPLEGATTVQWTVPDLKGQALTGFALVATSANGQHTWTQDVGPETTSLVVPGQGGDAPQRLAYGRAYSFQVVAKTVAASEPSPPSNSVDVYTGPAAIRVVNAERTGPQQWRYTVKADWQGRVGTINGGGSGLGAATGDPADRVTFDVGVAWDTTKDLTFQASLQGTRPAQHQLRQANPVPRFVGGVDPVWGPCSQNPDVPGDRVHENGSWQIQIDGGGEGAMQYVGAVQSTWAYAYGVNQPNPTQANEGFGTPPTNRDGTRIFTNGRRHYPGYTFFVSFRFEVQGYGWVTSGRPGQNAPAC